MAVQMYSPNTLSLLAVLILILTLSLSFYVRTTRENQINTRPDPRVLVLQGLLD